MKKNDIKNVKKLYDYYRTLLFNDDIPDSSQLEFKLHTLPFAIGYSKCCDKPLKSGAVHVIAFCKWFKFPEKDIKETLIHEMIHVWQAYHVKEDRYRRCTNTVAHDRVFKCKMSTINLILRKNMEDLVIDEVYRGKLTWDDFVTEEEKQKIEKKYHIRIK